MNERVCLDWHVPTAEWESFRTFVEAEFGSIEGYLGREAENAMKEYAGTDDYETVESQIDRLIEAAGRRTAGDAAKRKFTHSDAGTTRVQVRIDEDVKNNFKQVAAQGDNTLGVEFAKAIATYQAGGREKRLERKLERILDDAESLLAELTDEQSTDTLGAVDRKVITICSELPTEFVDDELNAVIHRVAGQGRRVSDPTLEKYRHLVLDRLDVEPHPEVDQNPNIPSGKRLWIPKQKALELAANDTPRECRLPVDLLDHEERVRRIQYELGLQAATTSSGTATVTATDVQTEILTDSISQSTVHTLMKDTGQTDGYQYTSTESPKLKVNLITLGKEEHDLFETIIQYREGVKSHEQDADPDPEPTGSSPTHSDSVGSC